MSAPAIAGAGWFSSTAGSKAGGDGEREQDDTHRAYGFPLQVRAWRYVIARQ